MTLKNRYIERTLNKICLIIIAISFCFIYIIEGFYFIFSGLHVRNNEESRMPTEGVGVDSGIHRIHRNYNQEYAHMEAWLDEHPEFVQDYFVRSVFFFF